MRDAPTQMNARRLVAFLVPVFGLMALHVPAASAGGAPTREFLPAAPFTSDAGQLCTFPVHFDILKQKEYATTFTDENGNPVRALVSGSLVVKMTNLTNGHSITVNASGPAEITFLSDGSQIARSKGQAIVFLFAGYGGGPALFLN